jgi:hypothetical protein
MVKISQLSFWFVNFGKRFASYDTNQRNSYLFLFCFTISLVLLTVLIILFSIPIEINSTSLANSVTKVSISQLLQKITLTP